MANLQQQTAATNIAAYAEGQYRTTGMSLPSLGAAAYVHAHQTSGHSTSYESSRCWFPLRARNGVRRYKVGKGTSRGAGPDGSYRVRAGADPRASGADPADISVEITDAWAAIMDQQFAYGRRFDEHGIVVLLGPVLDPSSTCGLGLIAGDDPNDINAFGAEGSGSQVGNVSGRSAPHSRPIHPLPPSGLADARAASARSEDAVLPRRSAPAADAGRVRTSGSLDAAFDDGQMEPLCGARSVVGAAVTNQILQA